jgi:L-fuconolactonase
MKIDTHQHYWHYRAQEFPWISAAMPALQRACLPQDNHAAMAAAGVTGVVAVQARTLLEETDFLLHVAAHNPEVLGVVGWADLASPDLEQQLEQWSAQPAFKGLRHILQDEPDVPAWVNAPAIQVGMQALQRRALVYDVLVFDRQLADVIDFCKRHDRHWLVLDHVGKPALRNWRNTEVQTRWIASLTELARLPHVVCKLSGLVTETDWSAGRGLSIEDGAQLLESFDRALEAFGPQRLMFGSDWPVCQLAAPYGAVHDLAASWASARLNAQEQQAFWAGNAVRCYGLAAH